MFAHNLRANNKSLDQPEVKRAFGKDITNISKGVFLNNLTKKVSHHHSETEKNHLQVERKTLKDPIYDYHTDIVAYMQSRPLIEELMQEEGTDVTDKMRQILIDWLVDVHQSFELKEQTLFLALSYLDQYQSRKAIKKEEYQLIGITCLWIASKYEEIYPPRMKTFVQVTANTYNAGQLKDMQGKIIQTLNFELTRVTPLSLLKVLELEQVSPGEKNICLAKYIIELSYLNGKILKRYNNKTLIFAAIKLADAICKKQTSVTLIQRPVQEEMYTCYKEMCILLQLENKYKLTAIKRKYQKEKYQYVGKIRLEV